ncbi:hypothetical protein [Marinovum algicola]|uniref:hypothetical protein n=1 Tax=Marinovum algicola TaxID=42444 RepID=UPI0024BAE988|nr:hypothetical protein [Marinovum algicola]
MRPEQVIAVQKDDGPRLIGDPATWRRLKWGWLESVRRDTSLTMTARMVAHALVLDFVNRDTLRCDPSYEEIGNVLGTSKHSVRRAVGQLYQAGWIVTEGGCGRGVSRGYGFLTRAEIIPLKGSKNAPSKGSKTATLSASQKVADLQPKGSKTATAYNNDINHGKTIARADTRASAHTRGKLSENPLVHRSAERAVAAFRGGRRDELLDAQPWVRDHILAAGMLTDAEVIEAGWSQAENEDRADD